MIDRIPLNRSVGQGSESRHKKVELALKDVDADTAARTLQSLRQTLLTDQNSRVRGGYLRLLNSSHADQTLKMEKRGWWSMAFNPNRNKETAQALLTLARQAGVNGGSLENYLTAKIGNGSKISVKTLEGHLKAALESLPQPNLSVRADPLVPHQSNRAPQMQAQHPDPLLIPHPPEVKNDGPRDSRPASLADAADAPFQPEALAKNILQSDDAGPEAPRNAEPLDPGRHQSVALGQSQPHRDPGQPDHDSLHHNPQNQAPSRGRAQSVLSPVVPPLNSQDEAERDDAVKPQSHRSSDAQSHRSADAQSHRSSDAQSHRSSDAQSHRSSDVQSQPVEPSDPIQEVSPEDLERLGEFKEFLSAQWDHLEDIRLMMGRVDGLKPPAHQFQTHESVLNFSSSLQELRAIEDGYDGRRQWENELKVQQDSLAKAKFYFSSELRQLELNLRLLDQGEVEFNQELTDDPEFGDSFAELKKEMGEFRDEFATLLNQAEFRKPSASEIERRQKDLIKQDADDLNNRLKALNPRCEGFSGSKVIKPLGDTVGRLISRALHPSSFELDNTFTPPQAKNDLRAMLDRVSAQMEEANALETDVENVHRNRQARLESVRQDFSHNPQLVQRHAATLKPSSVEGWFTDNRLRLKFAKESLRQMADKLSNAIEQFDELRDRELRKHPLDDRIQQLVADARKIASNKPHELNAVEWIEGVNKVLAGGAGNVAPNEAQRRQLKETLAQYGDSIQTKYRDALSLALEPDLAPKNEKLNQAIREFDLTTRAWDSRNVELGNALEEAQSELEQARGEFNDVGQQYAELSRQITLLSQLEQLEEDVAAGIVVTEEALAKLAAQLPDDLKERLSSSGSASEVHAEVSRERDLLDYHRSDGIYTLLKGELDALNTGADLLDQMPVQQQQQIRQREQELIQELQSRGLPLALRVQERELKLETAREELQAHQTQKPLLREEVAQLKTEIEALRSAFERNRAAFSAQLQRVRDILDED